MGHANVNDARRVGSEIKEEWNNIQDEAKSRAKQLASTTTDTLKRAGEYIKEHDFDAVASDVTRVVRRYPVQSVLVCLGVGYVVGRLIRKL
jgi:ElaB/YqjD/DUF883 family membrane-anchored ribosome-binding protein